MDYSPPGSFVHGDSPSKNAGVGCHSLPPGDLSNPRIVPGSPALQADSLSTEPSGKPQEYWSGLKGNSENFKNATVWVFEKKK